MMYVYFYHAYCANKSRSTFADSSGILRLHNKIDGSDAYNEARQLMHSALGDDYELGNMIVKSLSFLHEAEE